MSSELPTPGRNRVSAPGRSEPGWLAVVVPAEARRFRVADRDLAACLADAGAELADAGAEVEIVRAAEALRGEAPLAVVVVETLRRESRPLLVRALGRFVRSLETRLRAAQAQRALRGRGYENVSVLPWGLRERTRLPGLQTPSRSLKEVLPERALAIGRRGPTAPTVLETVLAAAERDVGFELRPRWASVRAGVVLLAVDGAVLRVAIGPDSLQITTQLAALEALAGVDLPGRVAQRVPWPLAHGHTGLAAWSLERLLPGASPPRVTTPALLEDCLDFLVSLARIRDAAESAASLVEQAEIVAEVCRPDSAGVARKLARDLERTLAAVPRGFGHGDFFHGNLLAEGDRLSGVLDWDAGGPGRLPLLDLCHLQLTRVDYGGDEQWGRAVLDRLLPSARDGGDDAVRRYCHRTGLEPDPKLLEALVLAYWLGYASYQLRAHEVRRSQPAWIEGNVELFLAEAG